MVSTHSSHRSSSSSPHSIVLDSSLGKPATGVPVSLQECHSPAFDGGPVIWEPLAHGYVHICVFFRHDLTPIPQGDKFGWPVHGLASSS